MGKLNLYAVMLGGEKLKQSLVEDHEVIFVVAGGPDEAKKTAKKKWTGKNVHVDSIQKINKVDNFNIIVSKK